MEKSIDHIRKWKSKNCVFETTLNCAVNGRFQQYLDILCMDLGVSPYRKMPNFLAEILAPYGAADYREVQREVDKARARGKKPRHVMLLDT